MIGGSTAGSKFQKTNDGDARSLCLANIAAVTPFVPVYMGLLAYLAATSSSFGHNRDSTGMSYCL